MVGYWEAAVSWRNIAISLVIRYEKLNGLRDRRPITGAARPAFRGTHLLSRAGCCPVFAWGIAAPACLPRQNVCATAVTQYTTSVRRATMNLSLGVWFMLWVWLSIICWVGLSVLSLFHVVIKTNVQVWLALTSIYWVGLVLAYIAVNLWSAPKGLK
jgi:hypothetical protein